MSNIELDTSDGYASDDSKKKKNPFFAWISGLGIKVKIFFVTLFSIIGGVLFLVLNKNINNKDILKLELKRVRKEIEIENTAKEIDKNTKKISSLESRATEIKEEIAEIEKIAPDKKTTPKELDDFFDKRGF